MMTRLVGAMLVAMLAVNSQASAQDSSDSASEIKKLEGNWKLVRQESKGNYRLPYGKPGLFIEENRVVWTQDGKERGGQTGDLTIDPTTSPKSIDVEITRGSNIGKKILGIYEIKGNKLTICWGEPGSEKRPKKFITRMAVGAGATMETYQSVDAGVGSGSKADRGSRDTDTKEKQASEGTTGELKKLEGNWEMVRQEHKGNMRLPYGKQGLFFEEGKITWTQDGREGGQTGDVTVDATTNPKSIDVEVTRGSLIGQKLLGIYEIRGNKLTICWGEPNSEKRPKKFITRTAVGAGAQLETYQKGKD